MPYLFFIALLLLAPVSAFAQNGYQLLEPLPGLSSGAGVSFAQLLSIFFTLALSLSAAAAVVMITLGGVQYMFSDVPGTKSAGRERIRNAVYGLILVFGAWVIIYTINPNLLLFNLNIGNVGGGPRSACPYLICSKPDRTVPRTPIGGREIPKEAPGAGWYYIDHLGDGSAKFYPSGPEGEAQCNADNKRAGHDGTCTPYNKSRS